MVLNEIRANIVLPPSDEGGGLPLGKTEGEIALNPNLSYKLTKKVNAVTLSKKPPKKAGSHKEV